MSAEAASTLRMARGLGPLRVETMAGTPAGREPAEAYGARRQLGLFTIAGHDRARTDGRIPFGLHLPCTRLSTSTERTPLARQSALFARARARADEILFPPNDD